MTTGEVTEQLRRIADELQSANDADPGALEVLTGIGVPIVLGIATVIVAVLGLVESRRGRQLQRTLERERLERDDLARRLRYAEELRSWARRGLIEISSERATIDGTTLSDLKSRARADGVTSIDRVADELTDILAEAPYMDAAASSEWVKRYVTLIRLIEMTLSRWVEKPNLSKDMRPVHARIAALEAERTGGPVTLPPVKQK